MRMVQVSGPAECIITPGLLGFNLLGFSNPTSGQRLIELAERMLEVTRHVTLAIGGRLPLNTFRRGSTASPTLHVSAV